MNNNYLKKFKENFNELQFHLERQFYQGRYDNGDIEAFYQKIKPLLTKISNRHNLEEHLAFIEFTKKQLPDAISYQNSEHFNQLLKEIYNQTKHLLETIDS